MEFKIIPQIEDRIKNYKLISAYDKGVQEYALELLDQLREYSEWENEEPCNEKLLRKAMLNGADNWSQYSWGGCSLIYDWEIAERLCTPSQLKKTNNGQWRLRRDLEWLDLQAKALRIASNWIVNEYRKIKKGEAICQPQF